jgi:hypothetical protein
VEEALSTDGVFQPDGSMWCVPASVATTLRAYDVQRTVRDVATGIGQPEQNIGNTVPRRAVRYLNHAQREHRYVGRVWHSGPRFRKATVRHIDADQPVIAYASAYHLPMWHEPENRGYFHAVTIAGYERHKHGLSWLVWDPAAGWTWIKAHVMFNAMRHHYLGAYAIA